MENKPVIISITGGSGSGKTSFIRDIGEAFAANEVCIMSMDEYYRDRSSQQIDAHGYENFDLPESLHLDQFYQDVLRVCQGESVCKQRYNYNNPGSAGEIIYKPAPVILIEGLFVLTHPALQDIVSYHVYIHASENLKLIRRIRRDQLERNYSLETVLHRFEHHVMPSEERFIRHLRETADVVINNNRSYQRGLEVLLLFIRSLLEKNDR